MENNSIQMETENLSACWKKQQVLNNINIRIKRGQLTCLTGPNGSGKSTLLTILSGIPEPGLSHTGKILLRNTDEQVTETTADRKSLPLLVSYLPQSEQSTWNFTGMDIVLMGRFPHTKGTGFYSIEDRNKAQEIIQKLNIEELAKKNIFEMSGGQWQKIKIARSLAQETDYIFLDEPVANLDFTYQDQLLSLLRETANTQNKGILASIHDINTASRFADSLVLLPNHSAAIQGKPEEILTEENLSLTYSGQTFGTFLHPKFNCVQVYPQQTPLQ